MGNGHKTDPDYLAKLRNIMSVLAQSQQYQPDMYTVCKAGISTAVFRGVFSPGYFGDSEYFAAAMPCVKGAKVLEIGTGTGLIALKCAADGAQKVVATDINPLAVDNARHNVMQHGLNDIIDVRQGYIFQPVKDEKFDLVFWNIPFCYLDSGIKLQLGLLPKISMLEKAVFNPYYNYLYEYLNGGFDCLTAGGKLLLGFSPTIGREDILDDLAADLSLTKTILSEVQTGMGQNTEILQILEFAKQ